MTKKTSAGKKTTKTVKKSDSADSIRQDLADELRSLIPKLDAEGLAFLVKQAAIHIYNMQVDELNKAADAANIAAARSNSITAKTQKPPPTRMSPAAFRIDATSAGYFMRYPNGDAIFSKSEMDRLVKIVNAGGTALEISERLYNWLERERRDILVEIPIRDKFDDQLKVLAGVIRKSFKVKK